MSNKTFGQLVILVILVAGGAMGTAYMMRGPAAVVPDAVVVAKPIVADLGDFFLALADIVERDREVLKTSGQFRTAYIGAAKMLVSNTNYTRASNRDQAISDKISGAIGLKDEALTPELRGKLVAVLREIGDGL